MVWIRSNIGMVVVADLVDSINRELKYFHQDGNNTTSPLYKCWLYRLSMKYCAMSVPSAQPSNITINIKPGSWWMQESESITLLDHIASFPGQYWRARTTTLPHTLRQLHWGLLRNILDILLRMIWSISSCLSLVICLAVWLHFKRSIFCCQYLGSISDMIGGWSLIYWTRTVSTLSSVLSIILVL